MPQSRRKRKQISPRALRVARLFGWRYSMSRRAWVHRVAGGRYGPAFVTEHEEHPTRPKRSKHSLPRREDWRRTGARHKALEARRRGRHEPPADS
ncbi:MAG: hypothetical protein ACTHN0_13495 [Aquihabitans sp.]